MLYRFSSKAAGEVLMLQASAKPLLAAMGKSDAPRGILQVADMPAALAGIEAAIAHEAAERAQAVREAAAEGRPAPRFEGISLKMRAQPLQEHIKRAHKQGVDLVWGV